jgi:hypothetical protein
MLLHSERGVNFRITSKITNRQKPAFKAQVVSRRNRLYAHAITPNKAIAKIACHTWGGREEVRDIGVNRSNAANSTIIIAAIAAHLSCSENEEFFDRVITHAVRLKPIVVVGNQKSNPRIGIGGCSQ